MHRFFASLVTLAMACAANAAAQEICWADRGGMPSPGVAERAFILAGTSDKRTAWSAATPVYRSRTAAEPNLTRVLQTLGHQDLLPEDQPRSRPLRCDSDYQGTILIRQVRALGPEHPYIRRLAENQLRALSNCSRRRSDEVLLPERNWSGLFAPGDASAREAEGDFAYLTGVAYFNARQYDAAREAFAAVGKDAASANRQAGRLMEVRSLRELGRADEAYDLAKHYRIEADAFWKTALDKQEDIIAQHSRSTDYATAHLEKIFRRAARLPIENEASGFRVEQAVEDFDLYFMNEFARTRKGDVAQLPHDWWLREAPPEGRRAFIAVHALAKRYDGIDWVQAYHASVAYDRDNTWFTGPDLDTGDPAYARVTEHAYAKWKVGSPRWAMIVARRMTPESGYIPEIAAFAHEMQVKAEACSLTPVDYVIYARVTHHLVRVLASNGKYDEAIEAWSALNRNRLYPQAEESGHTQAAFSKLLMMRGEYELLDRLEQIRLAGVRRTYKAVRSDVPSALWTVSTPDGLIEHHPGLYMSMLNQLPDEVIEAALTPPRGGPRLKYADAKKAAEVLWMRGFLFGDEALMARAEPLLLRSHPEFKRYFRQADAAKTPEARDFAFAVMVLRNPGLTPYADDVRAARDASIDTYDSYNPIQGNWWCDADDRAHLPGNAQRLQAGFFDFALKAERYPWGQEKDRIRRPGFSAEAETREIDEAWQHFRKSYPPFDMISEAEEARLATLPRGSEWLAAKVRAYIDSPDGKADRKAPSDERIPESLHRIVEATRYSCHTLKRGNAKTSLWAYKTLHTYYGDTSWAAETPYWFDTPGR